MQTPESNDRSIGEILIDSGKIKNLDIPRILKQQKQSSVSFGEAAKQLGLIREEDVLFALSQQFGFPYVTKPDGKLSKELVAAYKPFSKQVESLRGLRTQLKLRYFGKKKSTSSSLAILSPASGDGRSFVAANLALVFSQLGEKTLLIDADLRRSKQHQLFGVENKVGLSSILAGRGSIGNIHKIESFEHLSLLTSGPLPPNPLELFSRQVLEDFLAESSSIFDVIIVDTPALNEFSDGLMLASMLWGGVLIARKHETTSSELAHCVTSLAEADVNVLGGVLNEF